MNRPAWTWIAFAGCLAVVLGALMWISANVLRLEQARHGARIRAQIDEDVRLGLWRMDSAVATLIAEENARPYFEYRALYQPQRAYTKMFSSIDYGDVLIPSPLLTFESPYIHLHFQFLPDGKLTSPQAPVSNDRDLAEALYTTHETVEAATQRLKDLANRLSRDDVLVALGPAPTTPIPQVASPGDYQARVQQQASNLAQQKAAVQAPRVQPADVDEGLIAPTWIDDMLLLVRRVQVSEQTYVQGCWLNWPAIESWLLDDIGDLLPDAQLTRAPDSAPTGRMLAALPVQLDPGPAAIAPLGGMTPLRWSLLVAWACVLFAAGAVAVLLRGVMTLSERRGAFVSAVTHELRTPLTTFRMYTDMLSQDMVPDAEQRRRYLTTLSREATRLSHLVENVLAYARLERGGREASARPIDVDQLLDAVMPRLRERAADVGMQLDIAVTDAARAATVRADPSGVEQILFNLVDNACKYAGESNDKAIYLEGDAVSSGVELCVRDHGPGVASEVRARLFEPFSRSAEDAAGSAPGVGLGLALAHRYAGDMGGRLALDAGCNDGARFILFLPGAR